MAPPNPEELEKLIRTELKFRAFVACGWGLLVLFAMMGVLLGNPKGVIIGVITAVMWVLLRITREAFDSLRMLRAMRLEQQQSAPKDDDKSPPEPPTAA